jgi:hypothetical protein
MPFTTALPKLFTLKDTLTFGKHKDRNLKDVIDDDPQYIDWCFSNIEWFDLDAIAIDYLKEATDFYFLDHLEYKSYLDYVD